MTQDSTSRSMESLLESMSREQIISKLIDSGKILGKMKSDSDALAEENEELKRQIAQKDDVISDYSARRDQAKAEADMIVRNAQRRADAITAEAEASREAARIQVETTKEELARTVNNARAEADSIVEARLREAKGDIESLEAKRSEAKRTTITLFRNVSEQYDSLIDDLEGQISSFKDSKRKLEQSSEEVELEDFKNFNVSDYVSVPTPVASRVVDAGASVAHTAAPKTTGIDFDVSVLGDDDAEIDAVSTAASYGDFNPVTGTIESKIGVGNHDVLMDDSFDYLEDDIVVDAPATTISVGIDEDSAIGVFEDEYGKLESLPNLPDMSLLDDDDDEDEGADRFSNGTMKSFTSSFMAVSTDDDDDDIDALLEDIDLDSTLDDDDDTPSLQVPPKSNPTRKKRTGHWL